MPLFITQGKYTSQAWRGMMAKPKDRKEEVAKARAAVGGKLHDFYCTLGEYDFLLISEGPSEKESVAGRLVAAASGSVTDLKTTVAIRGAEMKQCLPKAASVAEVSPSGQVTNRGAARLARVRPSFFVRMERKLLGPWSAALQARCPRALLRSLAACWRSVCCAAGRHACASAGARR